MMFASLRTRLWLTYALVVAITLSVVGISLVVFLLRNPLIDRQTLANMEQVVNVVAAREEISNRLAIGTQELVERIDEVYDLRALLFQADGILIADSRAEFLPAIEIRNVEVLNRRAGVLRDLTGQPWLYVPHSLPDGRYLVLVSPRRGGLASIMTGRLGEIWRDDLLPPLVRAGVVAMLVALALAYWIARWVARPLQQIASASCQFAEGEYHNISIDGPSEVQELAKAFNEMADRVHASQQAQRDFVANVSHELKTPLTSIQGFAQAILDEAVETSESRYQAAGVIYVEAGRMYRLVLDLLELARLDASIAGLIREPVDLGPLLQATIVKFKPLAKSAQIEFINDIGSLPPILGDGDRLSQVFTNLVENALKFTPEGGEISLKASAGDSEIVVEVTDNGSGIPAQDHSRIFERFYQVDKSRRGDRQRGVGLGLSIAYEIVQAHGGDINVHQNTPHGSIFVVKIPFAHPESRPPR